MNCTTVTRFKPIINPSQISKETNEKDIRETKKQSKFLFMNLPEDIQIEILTFLPLDNQIMLGRTNKTLFALTQKSFKHRLVDFSSYPHHIKDRITDDSLKIFKYANYIKLTDFQSITHDGLSHLKAVVSLNLNKSINQPMSHIRRIQSATNFSTYGVTPSKIIERRSASTVPRFSPTPINRIDTNVFNLLENLKYISLENWTTLKDDDLKNFSQINEIDISGCLRITDKGLRYLINATSLKITGCYLITEEGVRHLEADFPNVNYSF